MTQAPPPPPSDPNDPMNPAGAPGGSAPPPPPPPPAPSAPEAGGYAPPPPAGGYGAAPGYGSSPGDQPMGYPGGGSAGSDYADWPKRALSGLIDWFGPGLLAGLVYQGSRGLGSVLWLAALAWALYNAYLGGQTGQSYGKKIAGTRLIAEATGAPPGGGLGIGRHFVHILDGIPCYLGFLWPLWDKKRQTFADKILKTVVVNAPAGR
jgi:uncharacterized RDD family membrane protein YckC